MLYFYGPKLCSHHSHQPHFQLQQEAHFNETLLIQHQMKGNVRD